MSKKKTEQNLKFAVLFFLGVAGIVFLSLLSRVFILFGESKFDSSSHFTLRVISEKTQFLSFSPRNSTIGILTFQNAPIPYEIPIDAKINFGSEFTSKNINSTLLRMLFDLRDQKEINFVDIFRLFLFSSSVKQRDVSEITISPSTDKVKKDLIISTFFVDPEVSEEKISIEVVNATNVYGLGNRIANLISNMGGNIILVSTGDIKKDSVVQYNNSSYTVDKLSKILKMKKEKRQTKSLSDVTIVIGNNYVR